jgi:hypothetical protein
MKKMQASIPGQNVVFALNSSSPLSALSCVLQARTQTAGDEVHGLETAWRLGIMNPDT